MGENQPGRRDPLRARALIAATTTSSLDRCANEAFWTSYLLYQRPPHLRGGQLADPAGGKSRNTAADYAMGPMHVSATPAGSGLEEFPQSVLLVTVEAVVLVALGAFGLAHLLTGFSGF